MATKGVGGNDGGEVDAVNLPSVKSIRIEDEMRTSYLDYAMSVIVARALPDVRDGLKPVHRRILYTMGEMGLSSGSAYRKCAAIDRKSTRLNSSHRT